MFLLRVSLSLGLLAEVLRVKLVGVLVVPLVAVDARYVDENHVVRPEDNVGAWDCVMAVDGPGVGAKRRVKPQGLMDDLVKVGKVLDKS